MKKEIIEAIDKVPKCEKCGALLSGFHNHTRSFYECRCGCRFSCRPFSHFELMEVEEIGINT